MPNKLTLFFALTTALYISGLIILAAPPAPETNYLASGYLR